MQVRSRAHLFGSGNIKNQLKMRLALLLLLLLRKLSWLLPICMLPFHMLFSSQAVFARQESAHVSELAADSSYQADLAVTFTECAVMMTAYLSIPLVAETTSVNTHIQALLDLGIVQENELVREEGNENISRSMLVKLALRAAGTELAGEDAEELGKHGLAIGLLDNGQDQTDWLEMEATRAEAITILYRLRQLLGMSNII